MKLFSLTPVLLLLSFSLAASAADRATPVTSPTDPEITVILTRVYRLEQTMRQLDSRISYLESLQVNPYPTPLPAVGFSCLTVDSGYSKTFLGKGKTKLEAEAVARQECGKAVNSSYCNQTVRCSNGVSDSTISGYFCTLTDSGYSRTFNGEGADAIEAEAHAKQACQGAINASYCGQVAVRCEASHR